MKTQIDPALQERLRQQDEDRRRVASRTRADFRFSKREQQLLIDPDFEDFFA